RRESLRSAAELFRSDVLSIHIKKGSNHVDFIGSCTLGADRTGAAGLATSTRGWTKNRGRMMSWLVLFSMAPLLVMGGVSVYQTREAATAFELAKAERLGQANADLIEAWMRARRDEIRYLAQLDGFASMDIEAVNDHLRELSQHNGHYDTIFLV